MREIPYGLPVEQLRKLQFLTGEFSGSQCVRMPGADGVTAMDSRWTGSWEPCDRYVHISQFTNNRRHQVHESVQIMATYHVERREYVFWVFASSTSDILELSGNFHGDALAVLGRGKMGGNQIEDVRLFLTPTRRGFDLNCQRREFLAWTAHCDCEYAVNEPSTTRHAPRIPWPPRGLG